MSGRGGVGGRGRSVGLYITVYIYYFIGNKSSTSDDDDVSNNNNNREKHKSKNKTNKEAIIPNCIVYFLPNDARHNFISLSSKLKENKEEKLVSFTSHLPPVYTTPGIGHLS